MAAKISVTVDDEGLAAARALAPDGNLSALVNEALSQRVRRDRLRALLADDERELGPIPDDAPRSGRRPTAVLVLDAGVPIAHERRDRTADAWLARAAALSW